MMTAKEKIGFLLKKGRRGSALIITLGILSLLLIVCMVFAFDARSQRKAAYNHAAGIRARLINESGFKRALGILDDLLTQGTFVTDGTALNPAAKFYTATGTWAGTKYLPTLTTGTAVDTLTNEAYAVSFEIASGEAEYTDNDFSSSISATATWDSIVSDSIIGNYTYLIIDKTGQLPPEYIGEATPSTLTGTLEDINIDSAGLTANYAVDSETCFSIADYFRNAVSVDQNKVLGLICPGMKPEKEVFWFPEYEDDGAGTELVCYDKEIFERMDITKVGTVAVVGAVSAVELYSFLLTSEDTTLFDVSSFTKKDSSKSLWLSKSKLSTLDTGDAVADSKMARRVAAQMVVNMFDYRDADASSVEQPSAAQIDATTGQISTLSTVPVTAPPIGSEAVVTGVESSLGLSELLLTATITRNATAGHDLAVEGSVQLVNPMNEVMRGTKVTIVLGYNINAIATDPPAWQSANEATITIDFSASPDASSFFSATPTAAVPATPGNWSGFSSSGTSPFLSPYVIEIAIKNITLIADPSGTPETVGYYPTFYNGASSDVYFSQWVCRDTDAKTYHAFIASEDPLFIPATPQESAATASLYWRAISGDIRGSFQLGAPGAFPNAAASTRFYDTLEYCDASCQDSNFTRVGQIGQVHSPHTPNKSIRLWIDTPGTDGEWQDAYLLDMFKAGDQSESRKININTTSDDVATAFFTNTTQANADALAANLISSNGSSGGVPLIYRGDIYKIFDQSLSGPVIAKSSDDQVDRIIESMIELVGTRQNYYHIITASRSVKDLGVIPAVAADAMGAVQISPTNYGKVEGGYKTLTEVYRDAWKQESKVLQINVLED